MRQTTLLLVASLAACGSTQPAVTTPDNPDTPPTTGPAMQDQVFELPEIALTAQVFQPEALSAPSMDFSVGGKRTIPDQRKRYKKAKGDEKLIEGDALAVMLWNGPVLESDKNRAEARELYREFVATGKAPEGTLVRAAAVELLLGDEARAAAAYDEIVTRFATSPTAGVNRAVKAYFQLRKGDDAGAAATLAGVSKGKDDAPEVSYVSAWIAFRKGDAAGAWKLLGHAVDRWGATGLPQLRRDAMLFASRAGVAPAEAVGILATAGKRDNTELPGLIAGLADAYRYGGRYQLRADTYELLAPKASPAALAEIRYQQADAEYRLDHPDKAADRAIEAWDTASMSKDIKDDVREALAKYLFALAAVDHATFSNGLDRRYGEAGKRLYAAYLKIPNRSDAADAQSRAALLDSGLAEAPDKAGGVYDQDTIRRRVVARLEEVNVCYEQVLQGSPQLAGTIKVTLDLTGGEITAVAPDPAAGSDGLGAVSRCLVERLDAWTFPTRHRPGLTRIVAAFGLSKAK